MPDSLKIQFAALSAETDGVVVALVGPDLAVPPHAARLLDKAGDLVDRAAKADGFKGKPGGFLDILAPEKVAAPGSSSPALARPRAGRNWMW